jgi:hypothetical protein
LKRLFKIVLYVCLFSIGICLLTPVGFRLWLKHEYHLPPEQTVRERFEKNRADYIQFVALLQRDHSAHPFVIDGDGRVGIDGVHSRLVPEYQHLIRKIGAKDATMREDGSIEFALYGFGCAICSDSYMGVRYVPNVRRMSAPWGWKQTAVISLDSAKLPHENGAVGTGLYVVPVEPEWFIYRLEYQE